MLKFIVQKLHREGYRFVTIAAAITFIFLLINNYLGLIALVITIWIYYFFRDPERFPINDENYIVSPADGKITQIIETNGPQEVGLKGTKYTRISIFMDVLCCHVNRVPCAGTVSEIFYKPGKYINATLDKASEDNERNYLKLKNSIERCLESKFEINQKKREAIMSKCNLDYSAVRLKRIFETVVKK